MMRIPGVTLTLRIEHIGEHQRRALTQTLQHLGRFGKRVGVYLSEQIRDSLIVAPACMRVILT